ncbi:uncharacterized protein A4U43_C03F3230 [Asparagus officinalis]|uniref:Phytocyanin domain-containing protein n=1 Tax=Asparagus officinalis TaxID=4686 RepID=A0A5P1F6Y7_ASPOF|nr:uncharacterized protein A4U43_C03F3230 [Asparagus officinalis]
MASYTSISSLCAVLLMCWAGWALATDYTVGGSQGWTTGVDYSSWTAGKTFKVGDNLVFSYAPERAPGDEVDGGRLQPRCSTSKLPSPDDSSALTTIPFQSGRHPLLRYCVSLPGALHRRQ